MTGRKKTGIALAAIALVAACEFGTSAVWVTGGNAESPEAFAVTDDMSTLFVYDASAAEPLVAFVPGVDSVVDSLPLASVWRVLDMVADPADSAAVVALHENGYVYRWKLDNNGLIKPSNPVSPKPAGVETARKYCDLAVGDDGDIYLTTVDTILGAEQVMLARRHAATGTWTTLLFEMGSSCAFVSYDRDHDKVYASSTGGLVKEYSKGLAIEDTFMMEVGDTVTGFDTRGNTALVQGYTGSPNYYNLLWLVDLTDGTLHDEEVSGVWWPKKAQIVIDGGVVRGVYASLTYDDAARASVQAIELLP